MSNKDIIEKIKLAEAVKPRDEWRANNRRFLLDQIADRQPAAMPAFGWQSYVRFFGFKIPQLAARPVGIIILVLGVALSSSVFMVSASQSSLPGDALYSVKIASEKVQSSFFTDPHDNLALEIKFANRRLAEMEQLKQQAGSDDKKERKVAQAASNLTKNLKNIQNNLDTIKKDGASNKLVAAADLVDGLDKGAASQIASDGTDLDGAKVALDETFNKALDMMTDSFQNDRLSYEAKGDIIKKINLKITETESKINVLITSLSQLEDPKVEVKAEDNTAEGETANELPPTKADISANLSSAQKLMAEAKKVMIISDVVAAADKLKEAKKLIAQAEEDMDKIRAYWAAEALKALEAEEKSEEACQENCQTTEESAVPAKTEEKKTN